MQAGDFYFTRFHGLKNARKEADPDAVAQLGIFETQVTNLPEHGSAVRVAVRVPAGGQRIHMKRPSAVSFSDRTRPNGFKSNYMSA
jgi:hypothetical protein